MEGEWTTRRLGEVATIIMGQSPPSSFYNEDGHGVPFYQGVKDFSSRYPRKRVYCTAPTRFAKPGDILFSVRAPIGEINRAAEYCSIGRGLAAIRGNSKWDSDFIEYVLKSIRQEWRILEGQGAVFGNAKKSDLENLLIPWPEKKERYAIARILGTLDDKIELNRRMNETLEAMAQALFKSWFVDFDPVVVNALRAGNPIPDKFTNRAAYYRNILRQKHSPLPRGEGLGVREKLPPKLLAYARSLRKNQTDAERLMWRLLRNRQFLGIKFRRQHPIEPYIVDFYAHELGLVIEIDGGHHVEPKQKAYDEKRTAFLEAKGLKVIRYWANDVLKETEAVLKDLYQRVVERKKQLPSPPAPLPGGEGSIFPEHILRLFPDRFVDSELGPIPEGWEATTIGAEFDLTMGQSPPGSTYNEKGEGLPFFQGRRDFGFRYPSNRVYCTAPTRIANAGDTLVSVRAPVGDINMAYETCCVGRGVAAVRHKSGSRSYTYYAMRALGERFKSYEAEGTVFGAINKKQFQNLPSIAPQPQVVSIFEELVYPLDENIRSFEEEIRILSGTRDTLLPKLISGELRVPDVEKILEEA